MAAQPHVVALARVPVVIFGLVNTMYMANEVATTGYVGKALRSSAIVPISGGLIARYVIGLFAGWFTPLTVPTPQESWHA